MPDDIDAQGYDEAERIRRWRILRFMGLGFTEPDAELLADSEADLHRMKALLAEGCSHETAERILS